MAKKATELSTLDKLIPAYGKDKGMVDKYKKTADAANKQIKEIMVKLNLTEYTAKGYTAKYSVSKKEEYKEEVLDYIKQFKELKSCIKTTEYIDWDVFEELVYAGKVSQETVAGLKNYRYYKETPKLTIKKVED